MAGRSRLAIVGFWEGNRHEAPFKDEGYAIFGLNHLHPYIPRWDAWIDMHEPNWSAKNMKPEVWADQEKFFRARHGKPLFMLNEYEEFPDSRAFPLGEVVEKFGRRYFTNGISYMIALALLDKANGAAIDRLELWGVDMRHSEEYQIQRPCTEFWLGVAQGLGIEVFIPPSAGLLTANALYGYEEEGGMIAEALRAHHEVVKKAIAQRDTLLAQAQTCDGLIQDNQEWIRRWIQRQRGGTL